MELQLPMSLKKFDFLFKIKFGKQEEHKGSFYLLILRL